MKTWFVKLFLGFTKLTGWLPAWLLFKPLVYKEPTARRRLPKNCILVSNHQSLLDFVLYLVVFPFRTVRFLMAEVLYNKGKLMSFLLNGWGGIKVDRDGKDFSFISRCIEILDKGGALGVFPQARLPIGGKPFPFTTSTAFIALHSSAPIVPVYTKGNYGIFKRAKVCIGAPFMLTDYKKEGVTEEEQLAHLTKVLEKKVMGLEALTRRKKHRVLGLHHFLMDCARPLYLPLRLAVRVKKRNLQGKRPKRIRGGAIMAVNHNSFVDPLVMAEAFLYRRMYYFAAETVMTGGIKSALLRGVGAIRIDRNIADIEAVNKAVSLLKDGHLVTVFPQGEIHTDDVIQALKPGTVLMALQAGVPIIPVHISPKPRLLQKRRMVVGEPIVPQQYCNKKIPDAATLETITKVLEQEINRLKQANREEK